MLFWLALICLFTQSSALAVTKTPSVTPTPTVLEESPTPSVTSDNINDIQKLREVVQAKVKEKLKQIINPTSKKAYIGKVIQVDSSSITIENLGTPKTFTLDAETMYVDQNRNKAKLDKIKVGQDILIMGIETAADGSFATKRVVIVDLSKVNYKKTVVVGKIVDISRSSPIFTLIPTKNKNTLFQIKTDNKTEILTTNKQKLKLTDIKSGHKIIAVLRPDEKISKTYTAVSIMDFDYSPPTSATPTPKR